MDKPGHCVVTTPAFLRDCAQAGVGDGELTAMVNSVAADPGEGDAVVGAGGLLKRRFAGRGKGKSGGYRALVAFLGENFPVFLLALISKGERANFSADEIAALRKEMSTLKAERRK